MVFESIVFLCKLNVLLCNILDFLIILSLTLHQFILVVLLKPLDLLGFSQQLRLQLFITSLHFSQLLLKLHLLLDNFTGSLFIMGTTTGTRTIIKLVLIIQVGYEIEVSRD